MLKIAEILAEIHTLLPLIEMIPVEINKVVHKHIISKALQKPVRMSPKGLLKVLFCLVYI